MLTCSDIAKVDPANQCSFAREYCQLSSEIPYGSLFYCSTWPFIIRIVLLIVVLMLLFATMSIAAFDYMSPNLGTLASKSGLSQSVLGVTVLAFANGSVDVFGAMVAVNAGEGGMAVGEVMGGALFVVAAIVGSMAIITPFQTDAHNFSRDASFLAASVILVMTIVYDNVVTLAEALLALCLYAVYALFVTYQHLTERIEPHAAPIAIPTDLEQAGSRPSRLSSPFDGEDHIYTPIRPSLYTAVDLNNRVSQQLHEIALAQQSPSSSRGSDVTRRSSAPDVLTTPDVPPELLCSPPSPKPTRQPYQVQFPLRRSSADRSAAETRHLLSPHNLPKLQTKGLSSLVRNTSPTSTQSAATEVVSRGTESSLLPVHSPINVNELVYRVLEPQRLAAGMHSTEDPDLQEVEEIGTREQVVWRVLLPAFRNWSELTPFNKLSRIVLAPCVLLQSWSIPTASTAKSWEAMCIYSVAVPASLPILTPSVDYSIVALLLIFMSGVAGLVWWGKWRRPPPPTLLSASVGFTMGLLWVLFLANELVGVLRILGAAFHVSNTIMGLTVFALGDSLGDFVSNVTIARIGYPAMAVAACFGGPIFTLLVGVGGSSLIAMLIRKKLELEIEVSRSIMLSGAGMLVILLYTTLAVAANRWYITRGIGVRMLLIWLVVEIIVVFLPHADANYE